MIDYHVHTARCGHADGEMSDYVAQARKIGLREIGFADHLPLLTTEDPSLTMTLDEFSGYVQEVHSLAGDADGIIVKLGIEADYLPGLERETAALLASCDFDYVIGSIHFIDGWGFDDGRYLEGYAQKDIHTIYEDYFKLVAQAAGSGMFDIIGHLDLVKKYGFRPETDITSLLEDTVAAIKEAGVCVEINTAGLRKPAGEVYPSEAILALCSKAGVPITLGSDAHRPDQVGMDFDHALRLAVAAGYRRLTVFDGRERDYIDIP
ncbi:MAG: histidinol-phosphatase HisJ family protein [Actinobacteria bacterium]|nr:histidinol-phosphatase HisJ family protein [Actinomycetota bacterium]